MKKEDLRKVEYSKFPVSSNPMYKTINFDGNIEPLKVENKNRTNIIQGYFHLWKKSVFEDGSELICALIETSEGNMSEVEPISQQLRFID